MKNSGRFLAFFVIIVLSLMFSGCGGGGGSDGDKKGNTDDSGPAYTGPKTPASITPANAQEILVKAYTLAMKKQGAIPAASTQVAATQIVDLTFTMKGEDGKVYMFKWFNVTLTESGGYNISGDFYHPDYGKVSVATPVAGGMTVDASGMPTGGKFIAQDEGGVTATLTPSGSALFIISVGDWTSGPIAWDDVTSGGASIESPQAYFPMGVGNKWVYTEDSGTLTKECTEITGIGAKVKVSADYWDAGTARTEFYAVGDDGWGISREDATSSEDGLTTVTTFAPLKPVFLSSITPGFEKEWSVTETSTVGAGAPFSQTVNYKLTVLGNEAVTAPIGTFANALKVEYAWWAGDSEPVVLEMWFAPHVGLVKIDEYGKTTELTGCIINN